jgi:hypothetical protein
MFLCCLRTTRGSGHRKNNREGRGGVWRRRVHSSLQHLWPFARKKTNHKDQVTTLKSPCFDLCVWQCNNSGKHGMIKLNQNVAGLCLFESTILISHQGENVSAPEDPREHCTQSHVSADTLKKLVNHLVPSLQSGDPFFIPAFLSTYRRFATTLQVLNLLFKR